MLITFYNIVLYNIEETCFNIISELTHAIINYDEDDRVNNFIIYLLLE